VVVKSFSCINDSVWADTLTAFYSVFVFFPYYFLSSSVIYLFVLLPLNYFLEVYFLSSFVILTIYLLLPPVFFTSFLIYVFFLYALFPLIFSSLLSYFLAFFHFVLRFFTALFFSLLVSPTLISSLFYFFIYFFYFFIFFGPLWVHVNTFMFVEEMGMGCRQFLSMWNCTLLCARYNPSPSPPLIIACVFNIRTQVFRTLSRV
jgi:hypothetical protein